MQKLEAFTDAWLERCHQLYTDSMNMHERIPDGKVLELAFEFICQPSKPRETLKGVRLMESLDEIFNGHGTVSRMILEMELLLSDAVTADIGSEDKDRASKTVLSSFPNYTVTTQVTRWITSAFVCWAVWSFVASHMFQEVVQ